MKQIFTLFMFVTFATLLNAQHTYNDYDANQNETFLGWEYNPILVANPDATGINTSANVAEWYRTWQQYGNIWSDLSGTIDFTTGTVFSMKVWSPITCDVLFKLEDGNGGFAERLQTITTANQWVQLDFDFSGEATGVYNKVVFFLDFASWTENTFYFDEIVGPHHSGSLTKPLLAADVQDNFENNGWGTITDWIFQDPGLDPLPTTVDPLNPSNNVADYNRSGTFEWTNAQAELSHRMDLTNRNVFEMKVYFPSGNDYTGTLSNTVALKLQNSLLGGNAWTTQAEIVHTVTDYDQWITLTFDYSAWSTTEDYDKIIVQFGGEGHWAPGQFYFDDLELIPWYPTPPYTYNDFDANQNHAFTGWPNVPTIVANPNPSGINTTANSAELIRGTEQYGHVYTILDGPINFTNASNFQVLVYSPIVCPVVMKIENQYNGGLFAERTSTVWVTNEWTLLNFDFSGEPNSTYDKIVLFFDFLSTNDNTFYFDEIIGPEYDAPKPVLALDVQDNFENDGWSTIDYWILQDPNMDTMQITTDPVNGANHVADYNRSGGFQYTNAQTILNHRLDLSERNKFEIDVYFPSSNNYTGSLTPTASLKLQNSLMGGNSWMTQTEIVHTITDFDQWQTLLFDFSAIPDSINYDQLVVQLGGEGHWEPGQFYFDNFYLKHVPFVTVASPNGGEEMELGSTFEIEWNYDYWEGDIKIELMKGMAAPQLIVYNLPASDTSFTWNIMTSLEPGDDYRVIITSLDNDFPTDTSDAYFTILESSTVQAGFSADPTTMLEGDSTFFTDESIGDPDSWLWTFEGGSPATFDGQQPPYITYAAAGTYDVSLEVSNGSDTDIVTLEGYITVGVMPVAEFEAGQTLIFAGETVDFTNLSVGDDLSYEWTFEGGTPETSTDENPSGILYSNAGIFDVTLVTYNEFGSDTLTKVDYIDAQPVGIAENEEALFSLYPNPANSELNIKFTEDGSYQVIISSMIGEVINEYAVNGHQGRFNLSGLESGIYLILVRDIDSDQSYVKKIIVTR